MRLQEGQDVKIEYNGKWLPAKVEEVDASMALVRFQMAKIECIFRGSTRIAPLDAERVRMLLFVILS